MSRAQIVEQAGIGRRGQKHAHVLGSNPVAALVGPQLRHRPAVDRDDEPLSGLGSPKHVGTLVPQSALWNGLHANECSIDATPSLDCPIQNDGPVDVRDEMLAILGREIRDFDYSTIDDPGFERMRRLTHAEYDRTVRDLIGVDLNPTDRFPDELTGSSGFENSSNTLFLQPSLMERYIAVAERIVELALPDEPTTETHRRTRDLIVVATPASGLGETEAAEVALRWDAARQQHAGLRRQPRRRQRARRERPPDAGRRPRRRDHQDRAVPRVCGADRPLSLHLSLLQRMGVSIDSFGTADGPLRELDG